jgi:hypothetical protein
MNSNFDETIFLGYADSRYANSLSQFGEPIFLPNSKGWVLKRPISGTSYFDIMGLYPLFCCQDESKLKDDIVNLNGKYISIAMVLDPLQKYDMNALESQFSDRYIPFKEHYIVDLKLPLEKVVSSHHRYYAKKSLKTTQIEHCSEPHSVLEKWCSLYDQLKKRHGFSGISQFSKKSFRKQFSVPGSFVFTAKLNDKIEGIQIWFMSGNRVYHHLSAYSDLGYRSRISYAMIWVVLHFFKERKADMANLGGGAGFKNKADGLTKFKKDWASETRTAYFAGKIINLPIYTQLTKKVSKSNSFYFPAYRDPGLTEK